MIKRLVVFLICFAILGLTLYGCRRDEKEAETTSMVYQDTVELPQIEYIGEEELKNILPINVARVDIENKREITVALIDVGISEFYLGSSYIYTNKDEIKSNHIDDDNNGYVDDVNGWNVLDDSGDVKNYNDK